MNNWDMNDMNPIPISGVSQFFGTSKMNPMHFLGGVSLLGVKIKGMGLRQSSSWQFGDCGCRSSVQDAWFFCVRGDPGWSTANKATTE